MTLNEKSKYLIIGSFISIYLCVIIFNPTQNALVFYKENSKHIQAYLPIQKGDTFQIIFKHSIHLTDVVEKHMILENNEIKQYEIVFKHFGIGMPSNAEVGEKFVYKNGKYYIENLNNFFPSLNIRNGKTVSEHRLIFGEGLSNKDNMVYFNDYLGPGAWYTLKVQKLSLWQYWRGVRIDE